MGNFLKELIRYGLLEPNRNTFVLFAFSLLIISTFIKTNLLGVSTQELFLSLGIILLGLYFISIMIYLCRYWFNLIRFRARYPLRLLNKKFFLYNNENAAYLIDICSKEIKWIENWTTASDLKFVGYWTVDNDKKGTIQNFTPLLSSEKVDLSDYSFGKGIRTRGVPGSGPTL